ncbi:MAG TPA: hypothetical protein PK095_16215 [Myxococcota bacterium]|nr:hypothetical protein [Myxococcota bacterium]
MTLPGQLIDASAFVDGRVVGDELGWIFETDGRKSERVPWPTWKGEAECAKDLKGRLAWPIEGSDQLLVLGDTPLIVEGRADCLAAVPLRRPLTTLGKKTWEVLADSPRVVLFESDLALGTLALIASEGDLPHLEVGGEVLEAVGTVHEDEDRLGCLSADERESMLVDDPEQTAAPVLHKVSATWSGSGRPEVLELTISQSCEGDPRYQGGAVKYEREMRWGLVREGSGWRQVELEVASDQSSSGDGAGMGHTRRQLVQIHALGKMALVGHQTWTESLDSSRFGSSLRGWVRSDWWLLPLARLSGGLDVLDMEDSGLRLTPPSDEPEREADREHTTGTHPVGGCGLALLADRATLTCGEDTQSVRLEHTTGTVTRRARVWDLGAALFLRIELEREDRYTEPNEEADAAPSEHTSQEALTRSVIVSKRKAAMVEVGASSSDFAM